MFEPHVLILTPVISQSADARANARHPILPLCDVNRHYLSLHGSSVALQLAMFDSREETKYSGECQPGGVSRDIRHSEFVQVR